MKKSDNGGFTMVEILARVLMAIAIIVTYLTLLGPIDFRP